MRYHNEELKGKNCIADGIRFASSVPMHDDYCYKTWAEFTALDDYETYVWNWLKYRAPMDLFRSGCVQWAQTPEDVVKGLTPEARKLILGKFLTRKQYEKRIKKIIN